MIHIVFSVDEKYIPHMGVAMTSILANASEKDEFFFHVISDSISEGSRSKILSLREIKHFELEIADAGEEIRGKIEKIKKIARCCHLTASETYFRLFIGSIFPDIERALYLDSDIVVLGSLAPLWKTDLASHTIAVVEELKRPVPPDFAMGIPHYFNSGVMLFNLDRWRSMGYEERCMGIENSVLEMIQFADQSILNHIFRDGDFVDLGIYYNYMVSQQKYMSDKDVYGSPQSEPIIIHYTSLKPWEVILDIFSQNSPRPRIFSHYWKYRLISPWRNEPFEGAIKWKEIFRYLTRHPKEAPFVMSTVKNWRKGIYRY